MPCPHVLILRDFRESAKKCSLMPLRGTPGIEFRRYQSDRRLDGAGRILLHHEGPELSPADAGHDLLLLDSSWTRLPKLVDTVDGEPIRRSLPRLVTAYPREGRIVLNPDGGLASVEALYAALCILGYPKPEWLRHYYFRDAFLAKNDWLASYTR
jgi:pre-rRNA-processing protein TSR3